MTRGQRQQLVLGLAFISPWIFGFCVFGIYPVAMAIYYSFCDYDILRTPVWIGVDNYTEMVGDALFWQALWNTAYYSVFAIPLGLILALACAVLLNKEIAGRSVFRTLFYIPSIVPLVAVAMIWIWLFNGQYGLVNHALSLVGLEGPLWLGDPNWTKNTLVLSQVWQIGGTMVLFLAGLQDVPRSLYESAELDGANGFQRFWNITIPMVSPVIYFNLIMGIIGAMQEFVKPFIMLPDGGPERSALLYAVYLYMHAFKYNNMGYACAMAMVLFLIILILTYVAHTGMKSRVYYAGD
ncbi:carbohydrate ABC transporter permease [Mucisphaera calidilacus]|uniref:Lactose transport system permease protein LacF n=1 Tax=Mucisphaera calidilacus TaxID=2527982 RepID=A0A518BVA3_9BACT|nr:sugar ABC transporter permease [Mucisphaera calidilacus]QDU70908.1 Lactose transport system permease protein LacF [Mucisphaera calidilacus]